MERVLERFRRRLVRALSSPGKAPKHAPWKTGFTRVMCSTLQCELRSTFPNLRVTNVIRLVTYYTLAPLESPDSSWMTRSHRSRRRDKGLWSLSTSYGIPVTIIYELGAYMLLPSTIQYCYTLPRGLLLYLCVVLFFGNVCLNKYLDKIK